MQGSVAPEKSPGITTVTGDYNMTGGTLEVEWDAAGTVAGVDFDQVQVGGMANLGGTLDLLLGFAPDTDDEFIVFTASSINGTFDAVLNQIVDPTTALAVIYTDTELRIEVANPGDADLDGDVDIDDLTILASVFDKSGNDWKTADFNGDTVTNLDDLTILGTFWNTGVALPGAVSFEAALQTVSFTVPEPASLIVLAVGGLALSRRRLAA